ncbi:AAA family ATPase [Hydrogenimonas urashimensis]|uniref:AAA family ATPase n=1 Tax=Hydrogenimonas urashimensis TaxID=2740515 RepID=UPI001916BE46|nr:AAA family ATPase [Hydrogenimonas urashimensis]
MKIEMLSSIEPSEASFILTSFMPIPRNAVTLLSSAGGVGKTRLALIMAARHVMETGEVSALWLTEDYPGQVRAIFNAMAADGLVNPDALPKMALILDAPPQLAKREMGLFKANYDEIQKIGDRLIDIGARFVVFDPLLAFYGGNENDNSEARVFIQAFAEWAKASQITTLIIHHANKDGASRGATAFHDGVRARYELSFIVDDEGEPDIDKLEMGYRKCALKKDNWGVRKHLWKLTDGKDHFEIKIATPMHRPEPKTEGMVVIDFPENVA